MTEFMPSTSEEAALTLADRVFGQIQNAIVKGELRAGSKISESELAARYGVSRGPLREALNRLESRQLLVRTPHVGMRVASLSVEELLEIYRVRESLEGLAARLAAENATAAEIDGLKALLAYHQEQAELQAGTGYYQEEGDFDLHYRLIQASHNKVLAQMLCGELYHRVRLYRYQFSGTAGRPHKAFAEHSQIIAAIENRDGEMAELLMRRHIGAARKNIEAHHQSASGLQQVQTP
jgi:DNA-binding GntR family transcriptional regulator